MIKKILTIGGATRDIFIQYDNPEVLQLEGKSGRRAYLVLEEGKKIDVQQLVYATGGGATNSAVSFKRLGFEVESFFKTGADNQGEYILADLKREGINVSHVICSTDVATGTSFIIPSASGDRTVLVFRGANAHLKLHEIPAEAIARSAQLYITSLSGAASELLVPITDLAKKHNIPVAVNPGSSQLAAGADALRESLHNIDIVILNASEANMLMMSLVQTCEPLRNKILKPMRSPKNEAPQLLREPVTFKDLCFDIRHFFQEVLSRGPRIVVVTNGAEGVYVATKECIYFHPSLPVKLVSTIGAGDAFGSCFVASILQGTSIEQAMLRGIINSGSVLSFLAAKTGLLTAEALEKKIAEVSQNLVQKFSCDV